MHFVFIPQVHWLHISCVARVAHKILITFDKRKSRAYNFYSAHNLPFVSTVGLMADTNAQYTTYRYDFVVRAIRVFEFIFKSIVP